MAAKARFTVSGPDVDRSYPSEGPALSAAITFAARARTDATFYCRTPTGNPYGRVERHPGGRILIYRIEGGTK